MKPRAVKLCSRSIAHGRVPAYRLRVNTARPATKWIGNGSSHWPSNPRYSAVAIEEEASASIDSAVRFGVPVDPEVRTTAAIASSPSSSARATGFTT